MLGVGDGVAEGLALHREHLHALGAVMHGGGLARLLELGLAPRGNLLKHLVARHIRAPNFFMIFTSPLPMSLPTSSGARPAFSNRIAIENSGALFRQIITALCGRVSCPQSVKCLTSPSFAHSGQRMWGARHRDSSTTLIGHRKVVERVS
jgi:hypothetical protein